MKNRDFTECRSNRYQPIIMETPIAPENLADFSDAKGLTNSSILHCEEIDEIDEQLKQAYWRIIEETLTDRQKEVIKLYAGGLTQTEIAKKLKVNQSSIAKSIHGNCDYKHKNGPKVYGGAQKKLRKTAMKDPEIQKLLQRKQELLNDVW